MMNIITLLILIIALITLSGCYANKYKTTTNSAQDFFTKGYCVQTVAKTVAPGDVAVTGLVEGEWTTYNLVTFPPAFMEWNINRRLGYMETLRKMFRRESENMPELAGPHNGIVATYGFAGQGSQFKLNNAVKGMGFLPRADKIDSVLTMLKNTIDKSPTDKLNILEGMYNNAANIFALDRQVSLELYAEPKFLTQSFCNQMLNPVSTVVYLDIPSYKFKAITRLLDPADPDLTDYEKQVVEYVNLIHSYFHGAFDKQFITTIYYAVEVYDNSPKRSDARGLKIAP